MYNMYKASVSPGSVQQIMLYWASITNLRYVGSARTTLKTRFLAIPLLL
jgi:hypothetical protein